MTKTINSASKGLWTRIMETGQEFLNNLKLHLESLNKQNIGTQNPNNATQQNTQGDLLEGLITELSDREKLDTMLNDNSILPTAAPTPVVPSPKTSESSFVTTPTVVQPTQVAPKSAETVVLNSPSTKPQISNPQPVKSFAGEITPEVLSSYSKQYGVPNTKITDALLRAAKTAGTDPDILFKFARAESAFDHQAKAKTSSATGLFQFLDKTWKYVMEDLGGKQNFNLTGNRKDPYENAMAQTIYLNEIKRNLAPIRKSGEFSTGELYLGHFAGPSTAKKVIQLLDKGHGDQSATTVFSKAQINANKPIFLNKEGKVQSLSEVVKTLNKKVS